MDIFKSRFFFRLPVFRFCRLHFFFSSSIDIVLKSGHYTALCLRFGFLICLKGLFVLLSFLWLGLYLVKKMRRRKKQNKTGEQVDYLNPSVEKPLEKFSTNIYNHQAATGIAATGHRILHNNTGRGGYIHRSNNNSENQPP